MHIYLNITSGLIYSLVKLFHSSLLQSKQHPFSDVFDKNHKKKKNVRQVWINVLQFGNSTPRTEAKIHGRSLMTTRGHGRDQELVHPTMWASFLATNVGSSISEVEAVGIISSRGNQPLLSIKLENRADFRATLRTAEGWRHDWGRKMCIDTDKWDTQRCQCQSYWPRGHGAT